MSLDTRFEAPQLVIQGELVVKPTYDDVRPNARKIELSLGNRIPGASEEVDAFTDLINYCDEKAKEVTDSKDARLVEFSDKIASIREGKAQTKDIFENHRIKLANALAEKADELLVRFDAETYAIIRIKLELNAAESNRTEAQNSITKTNQSITAKTEELLNEQSTYSNFQDRHGRVLARLDDTDETDPYVESVESSDDSIDASIRPREVYEEEEAALDEALIDQSAIVTKLTSELEQLYDARAKLITGEENISRFIEGSKAKIDFFEQDLLPIYYSTMAKIAKVAEYVIDDIATFKAEGGTDIAEIDRLLDEIRKIKQVSSQYSYSYFSANQASQRKLRLLDYSSERGPGFPHIPNIDTDDPEFFKLATNSVTIVSSLRVTAGFIHTKKAEYDAIYAEELQDADAEELQIQSEKSHFESVARSVERGIERAKILCQGLASTQYTLDTETAVFEADVTLFREQIAQSKENYRTRDAVSETARQEAAEAKAEVERVELEIAQLEQHAVELGRRHDESRERGAAQLDGAVIESILIEQDGNGYYHTEQRVWTPNDFLSLSGIYREKGNEKVIRDSELVQKRTAHSDIEKEKTSLRANRRELDSKLMRRQAEYEAMKKNITAQMKIDRENADAKLSAAEQWLEVNSNKPKQNDIQDSNASVEPSTATPSSTEWDSVKPTANYPNVDGQAKEEHTFGKVTGIGKTVLSNVRQAVRRT